ncbi:MAG: hypothetical protein LBK68_05585 [Candidatus Margulisbacteria bacterium]|jgi:hypothetical protein|nr:hypothetical protein [Candidatus Margulisiibacteriota bacterium]
MANLMETYSFIQKPRKPMQADKTTIDYSYSSSANLDKKTNYLMEMLKFLPNYERKGFALEENADDYDQYGKRVDNSPVFGLVTGSAKAYGGAYGVVGLQFMADNAADFQHLDGAAVAGPLNGLISDVLWGKVQFNLQSETRSYYDMMMTGLDDMSPEKTFYVLTAMLESRSRVTSTLSEIFGKPTMSDGERVAAFETWYAQNTGAESGKAAFLQFFLDANQSFVSHVLPLFGGSDEHLQSASDKTQAQSFMTTLQSKVQTYLASLSGEAKQEASAIWSAWLSPTDLPTAAQNQTATRDTVWGRQVQKVLQGEMDKIVNSNLASRISYRFRQEAYKRAKEEYDEKIEEEENLEFERERKIKKEQAERKELEEKIAAKNREQAKVNTGVKQQTQTAKPQQQQQKPQQQQTQQVQRQQVKAAAAPAKAAPKAITTAAKAPVKTAAPKITTAAKPVKVVAAKPVNTPTAKKPVLRVRQGQQQRVSAVSQTKVAKQVQKKVLTQYSARTSKGRRVKVNRRRSRNVWGKPSVFK